MPDFNPPRTILDLVESMRELEQRAALQYRPAVDDILQTSSRGVPPRSRKGKPGAERGGRHLGAQPSVGRS